MVNEALTRPERLLSDAQARAERMIDHADNKAGTILREARTEARILDKQSQDRSTLLECEVTRKHTEIIGSIGQEKETLEKKVDELRMFEREYRARLMAYLESQLGELHERRSGRQQPRSVPSRTSSRPGNRKVQQVLAESEQRPVARLPAAVAS